MPPGNPPGPNKLRFVLGGLTSIGTAVAGYYLKTSWRELLSEYEEMDKDLEEHGLVVVLSYTGEKIHTSAPYPCRLCFFGPDGSVYRRRDQRGQPWKDYKECDPQGDPRIEKPGPIRRKK